MTSTQCSPPRTFCPHCGEKHRHDFSRHESACFEAKVLAWYRATYDDDQASDELVLARLAAWARGQPLGPEVHGIPRRRGVAPPEGPPRRCGVCDGTGIVTALPLL
jgi:hypothetical protein